MPYIGARFRYKGNDFTVRLHGPNDDFDTSFDELKNKSYELLSRYTLLTTIDVPDTCNWLAHELCNFYVDGEVVVWAQVESISNDGAMYGSSAEKV
jgi:hypothetical protein